MVWRRVEYLSIAVGCRGYLSASEFFDGRSLEITLEYSDLMDLRYIQIFIYKFMYTYICIHTFIAIY